MAFLYGRAGRLTAVNGGFRLGQSKNDIEWTIYNKAHFLASPGHPVVTLFRRAPHATAVRNLIAKGCLRLREGTRAARDPAAGFLQPGRPDRARRRRNRQGAACACLCVSLCLSVSLPGRRGRQGGAATRRARRGILCRLGLAQAAGTIAGGLPGTVTLDLAAALFPGGPTGAHSTDGGGLPDFLANVVGIMAASDSGDEVATARPAGAASTVHTAVVWL
jgi:hypothetical protein